MGSLCERRLQSAFWRYGHYWDRYGGRNATSFHAYAAEQIAGFRNCTASGHSTFTCALYLESLSQELEDVFFHCDQLLRGMYSIWLHLWLSFFPRESFLVVKSEELRAAPQATLRAIFAHLALAEPSPEQWQRILAARAQQGAGAAEREVLPETRQLVADFYTPFNHDLARVLQDEKWLWR